MAAEEGTQGFVHRMSGEGVESWNDSRARTQALRPK